jgi:hypothetical protein
MPTKRRYAVEAETGRVKGIDDGKKGSEEVRRVEQEKGVDCGKMRSCP